MADLMKSTTTYQKLVSQYGNFVVPAMKIKVNGQDTITSMNLHVAELSVVVSVKAAGYAVIKIDSGYDYEKTAFQSNMKDKFKPGTVVSVEIGYLSHTECIFKGYVAMVGVELSDTRYFVVTLMDARRLMITSGKKHILHDVKNYSDAFQAVIGNYSKLCTAKIDATKDQLEQPVSQISSDYDFITKELARKGKREFFIFADKAYYRKLDESTSPVMTLKYGRELYELKVDYEYVDAKIKVLGYDQGKEESISFEKPVKSILAQTSIMTTPEYVVVDGDADTKEKAQNRAEFLARQEWMRTCTGRGKTIGIPELVPGRYVAIEGVDPMVNKKYYLTEVKHSIVAMEFTTEFEIGGVSG